MANVSKNAGKAALLQGLPPAPGVVEGTPSAPARESAREDQNIATNQSNKAATQQTPAATAAVPKQSAMRFEVIDPSADTTYRYPDAGAATAKADEMGLRRIVYREKDGSAKQVDKVDGQWYVRAEQTRPQDMNKPAGAADRLLANMENVDATNKAKGAQTEKSGAAASTTKKADKGEKEPVFGESGAFNINDQWSTSIRYEGKLVDGKVSELSVKFTNGRKQVAAVNFASRETAVDVLGERNVANIEVGLGKDKEAMPAGVTKGKLQAEDLAFKKSYTLDRRPENLIEQDTSREAVKETDAEVRQWVANRRQQLRQQRLQNEQAEANEKDATADQFKASTDRNAEAKDKTQPGRGDAAQKPNLEKEPAPGAAGKDDRSKAVPEHVKQRFLQTEDKYYFPDKTFAFEDRGAKLATNSENQEVVRSLIAIAQARGWDNITVRGSEEFRRSAWLEASTQGIEVRGYKPTAVEKAHLASILEKQAGREADLPNSVSKGRDREAGQAQAPQQGKDGQEAAQTAPQATKEVSVKSRPGATVGKLVDHGEAHYQHDPKKEKSYFVTVETERGQKTLWGVDLERAVAESKVQIGENISVEHQGKKPVTAKEKVYDKAGNVTGEREVETYRNKWLVGSVDKAQAFANGDRMEAVAKHPDLAPAFGAMAAARKVAEKAWPGNKAEQDRFVTATAQVLADKIAAGEEVPAPKIRETIKAQQQTAEQDKAKKAGKELERER